MIDARRTNTQRSARRALVLAVLCVASLATTLVMASPAASSLSWPGPSLASPALSTANPPSFTWTGATTLGAGASNWSTTTNWGGTAPSGTVGTLSFPPLTNAECTAAAPTETCYASNNNLSSLTANAITIAAYFPYYITGNALTLGAGGITATPTANVTSYSNVPTIDTPIALGADQTWTIQSSQFFLRGSVTGTHTLGIGFTGAGSSFLDVTGDTEVGAVAATLSGTTTSVRSGAATLSGSTTSTRTELAPPLTIGVAPAVFLRRRSTLYKTGRPKKAVIAASPTGAVNPVHTITQDDATAGFFDEGLHKTNSNLANLLGTGSTTASCSCTGNVVIEGPDLEGAGSLNGTNGNPVTFSNGAGLAAFGGGTVGPLTMSGGQIQVGEGRSSDGVLTVNGNATVNSAEVSLFINQAGTTAGTDYSQLRVNGPLSLASASLSLFGGEPGGQQACPTLAPGAVDTLISAASVTGTFNNIPDGTVIPLYGCTSTANTVTINYTATTVTATAPARPLSLSVPSVVHLTVGRPYHGSPVVGGGTPPYTWSITQGSLPTMTNSSFDPATGAISGTPEYAGTSAFTVTVTDSSTPTSSVSRRVTVDVTPPQPLQHWQLCSHNSGNCPPSQGSNVSVVTSPHVAIVLVGNWWCTLYGSHLPSQCSSWTPSTCPGYVAQSCPVEASDLLGALNSLLANDYSDTGQGGYDWGLSKFYGVTNCGFLSSCQTTYVGPGVTRRYYAPLGGLLYAGPVIPGTGPLNNGKTGPLVTGLQGVLNGFAGGFVGIHSQADVNNTVFIMLYAPDLLTCGNPSTNLETLGGRPGLYGNFVYASVYLEDRQHFCPGDVSSTNSPRQFATFAVSHELDEAITDPGEGPDGWIVLADNHQMQVDDPCYLRSADGRTGYGLPGGPNPPAPPPYYSNFTRDSRGTVVSAYVNPLTSHCWPTADTGLPPG
jgi:hypothetical protein